jgi:hypothetical protein
MLFHSEPETSLIKIQQTRTRRTFHETEITVPGRCALPHPHCGELLSQLETRMQTPGNSTELELSDFLTRHLTNGSRGTHEDYFRRSEWGSMCVSPPYRGHCQVFNDLPTFKFTETSQRPLVHGQKSPRIRPRHRPQQAYLPNIAASEVPKITPDSRSRHRPRLGISTWSTMILSTATS